MNPFSPDHEPSTAPRWIQQLFHGFMTLLLLALIFSVSGSLVFLQGNRSSEVALAETHTSAWIRFCVGGVIGTGIFIYLMKRKNTPPI